MQNQNNFIEQFSWKKISKSASNNAAKAAKAAKEAEAKAAKAAQEAAIASNDLKVIKEQMMDCSTICSDSRIKEKNNCGNVCAGVVKTISDKL